MRVFLALLLSLILFTSYSQNIVYDSLFENFGNFFPNNQPSKDWKMGVSRNMAIDQTQIDDKIAVAFNFKVSSVQVDPDYAMAQMKEEMKAGDLYEVSISIKKDRFTPLNIREFQVQFAASFNMDLGFMHGSAKEQMVSIPLDSCSTSDFVTISQVYEAQGGEEYVYIGSLNQKFNLKESTALGLLLADKTYGTLPHNCTYYVNAISVKKIGSSGGKMKASIAENRYNLKLENSNLIINGGAEATLHKRHYVNSYTNKSTGTVLAPYAYSLTKFSPSIHQLDSNDYRSEYDLGNLCYMGDGQYILDVLHTNEYHEYKQVVGKVEGKEYDTYHKYENAPTGEISNYAFGQYLVLNLKEPLEKNSTYHGSVMMKLNEGSSFGVKHLGIHFMDTLQSQVRDSLWSRSPDEVISIENLTDSKAWSELNFNYTARGGEQFIIIGHLQELAGVVKNKNFVPQVYDDCGPKEWNCIDHYIYYKDSLFARYQLDNFALIKGNSRQDASIVFPAGKRVQMEVVYSEVLKSEGVDDKLDRVKRTLINAQQVLRVEDAICIVDLRKNEPVTFEPNPIINKKKIIKKLDKPKAVKKIKIPEIPKELILFGEGADDVNLNHLVIVGDQNLNMTLIQKKLSKFMSNGGQLTIFYVGNDDQFSPFKDKINWVDQNRIFDASELSEDQMVKILLGVD